MKGLRRRSGDGDVPLVADLHARLGMYTRAGQLRCKGCGRWADDDAQAGGWGYYQPYPADKPSPYCPECAAIEFGLRPVQRGVE